MARRECAMAARSPCNGARRGAEDRDGALATSTTPRASGDSGGAYADTMEIARRFNLNNAHVRRLLRFGYFAPDIVEAIVEDRQPRSLIVKRLLQGIPCAWSEQHAAFGFAS